MQPRSNHAWPHVAKANGSNWLKWVGASIGAPTRPRASASAASWMLACPSTSWCCSICAGERSGPTSVISVANPMSRTVVPARSAPRMPPPPARASRRRRGPRPVVRHDLAGPRRLLHLAACDEAPHDGFDVEHGRAVDGVEPAHDEARPVDLEEAAHAHGGAGWAGPPPRGGGARPRP